ncbi:DMT family transporter [Actinoallomurus sp. NPDC052308]|uniref:DMT family transporter n=1 Tax=Actinoallomurus sp. NPDC052308 TaxID=3155530 RepID=UPI003422E849
MTLVSERPVRSRSVRGPALCLAAATGFGLSVVFAKEAGRAGTGVESMLAIRFAIAAVVCWAIVARRRPAFPTRRALLACAGLGLVGYAAQSALYFTSLTRIDGGLAALLLYTYPALVTLVAVALRREHLDAKRAAAIVCSAAGLALLLGSGHLGGTDLAGGITLALGSAGLYALYLTVADRLPHDLDLFLTSAIVCTGAALSLTTWCALTGSADLAAPRSWPPSPFSAAGAGRTRGSGRRSPPARLSEEGPSPCARGWSLPDLRLGQSAKRNPGTTGKAGNARRAGACLRSGRAGR